MNTRIYPLVIAGHEDVGLEVVEQHTTPQQLTFSIRSADVGADVNLDRDDVVSLYNALRDWLADKAHEGHPGA